MIRPKTNGTVRSMSGWARQQLPIEKPPQLSRCATQLCFEVLCSKHDVGGDGDREKRTCSTIGPKGSS